MVLSFLFGGVDRTPTDTLKISPAELRIPSASTCLLHRFTILSITRWVDRAAGGPPPSGCPRSDYRFIVDLVAPGSRVLDLGCGEGDLLAALIREKQVRAEGIELSEECIQACVAQGLTNIH